MFVYSDFYKAQQTIITMQLQFDTIPFTANDGFECNLLHVVTASPATRGPVLLVHGAGVSANIFNPPHPDNLIRTLVNEGYDVWLENWRGSIALGPNEWDLDQAAINDHPAAVKKIIALTGTRTIKAIIHCQGSTSFMISAALGLLPEVNLIISNAVSLHPVVSGFSRFKLAVFLPLVGLWFRYLNPQWGLRAPTIGSKLLRAFVWLTHWEKDTMVGKFVSFTYGTGWPALWRLENLDAATKEWIQHEFAEVPISFFRHIRKCIRKGELVSVTGQTSYLSHFQSDARFVLFAGEKNRCFLPQSQQCTFDFLEARDPGRHSLHRIKNYSHLDLFWGKNAHLDVFPLILHALNQDNHGNTEKDQKLQRQARTG